ncbi:endonuclease/exonuclease/phosphatase family protein [Pannonibacter tanglangensis]|uniref:Endonuclease/exonuclease/phosphatase family protein n=1 Tax=Pannonibacter tanglangensis TaxID=2750084 RepID=A0ABW9ZJT6_9HYPH|nr:endonuclease/exonuclease/phosphatase family protein [Pannonibacter sp. XCT-34]NBN63287.1 endonuclease/exonuclease/phosphatase family protein [Pannonibacter sp. XCT-34]
MNTLAASPSRFRRLLRGLFRLAAWGGAIVALGMGALALMPFVASDFWFADNMSFFLPQLIGCGGLALLGAALCRVLAGRRLRRTVFAGVAAVALAALAGSTVLTALRTASVLAIGRAGESDLARQPDGQPFRVVSINLEMRYLGDAEFMAYLESLNADVLVFQETNWRQQLRYREKIRKETGPLVGLGPYFSTHVIGTLGSITFFSRYPILSSESIPVGDVCGAGRWGEREILRITLDVKGKPVTFVALHPESPRSPCRFEARQNYYATLGLTLAALRREGQGPVLLAGDWNMSPWSAHFSQLLEAGGLKTRFPTFMPVITRFFFDYRLSWFLGSAVDHIAVSPDVEIRSVTLGPDVGSDHVPLIADLQLP